VTAEGATISPTVHGVITESVAFLPLVLLLSRILKKQILLTQKGVRDRWWRKQIYTGIYSRPEL